MNVQVYNPEKKIQKLTISDLDLYLEHNNLTPEGKLYKRQKIPLVEAILANTIAGQICHNLAKNHEPNCDISASEIESKDEEVILYITTKP